MLKTLYATKQKDGGVTIYKPNGSIACKFEPWRSSKPTRRNKYFTLNCWKYKLEWLD